MKALGLAVLNGVESPYSMAIPKEQAEQNVGRVTFFCHGYLNYIWYVT